MRRAGSISGWLIASSARAALAGALLLPLGLSGFGREGQVGETLCTAGEEILFSCGSGGRIGSLCAPTGGGPADRLTYRYGREGRIEISYSAEPGNGNRFKATVAPANPRAQVRQVWFDRGPYRYLMSECVGGGCTRPAGLAVLRGDTVLKNARCSTAEGERPWFSQALADFGPSDTLKPKTSLLLVEEADNLIEKLY